MKFTLALSTFGATSLVAVNASAHGDHSLFSTYHSLLHGLMIEHSAISIVLLATAATVLLTLQKKF